MSIEKWMARWKIWADGPVFTGDNALTRRDRVKLAHLMSGDPPPVGAYSARPGDWWVYGV